MSEPKDEPSTMTRPPASTRQRRDQEPRLDDEVDEASRESFPASDAPSWTGSSADASPRRRLGRHLRSDAADGADGDRSDERSDDR